MNVAQIVYNYYSGGESFGLMSDLLGQSGNGSSTILTRMFFTGVTSGGQYQGTYSAASTYSANNIIQYPSSDSPLRYRANQSTSAGQSPDTNPEKWDLEVGFEMIQDLGSSVYARYSLGIRNDAMIRLNGIERGAIAASSFLRYRSNYVGTGTANLITTSASAISIPTTHPSSRTLTVDTGLSEFFDSSTLGESTASFSIPTTHPTMLTVTLPSGLGLALGDTITLYLDDNNFVVCAVARYNDSTGASYLASTAHVGSGTASSWTVKKEKLIYITWAADAAGRNMFALIQTYNSGTGEMVFNTIAHTGTLASNTGWNIYRQKTPFAPGASNNGSWHLGTAPSPKVGYWMWGSCHGTKLIHRSNKTAGGTGWTYIYASGPDLGSVSDTTIDTYNSTTITGQSTTVFDQLTPGTHYFLAISCASPSPSSTNTTANIDGQAIASGTTQSFQEHYNYDVFTPDVTAGPLGSESFGEIAYNYRDTDGGDTTRWLPEHSNIITTTGRGNRVFTIDGNVVDHEDEDDPYMLTFRSFTTGQLDQTLTIIHPQATGDMGAMTVQHIFNKNGLYYRLDLTWAQAGVITAGYNNMVFLGESWFNKVLCEDAQVLTRPADNTSENLTASQADQASYLFYSTGSAPLSDFVLAQFWPNPTRDWRIGGANKGTPFMQDFTGAGNAKWYPFVYSTYSFSAAEVMTVEGRLYAGNKGNLVLT